MCIKILQITTVAMFAVMVLAGIFVFIFAPDRLADFAQLIQILFPIFLTEVIPALIGTPLTEWVRSRNAAKENSPG